MANLTHLHVHTQYSILDGASNVEKLIARAKELGMNALAITDHGNMFGAKHFHKAALSAGIKPILGCEAYVARRTRHDKNDKIDRSGYHLILLAKNMTGYKNLIKMVSYSWTEGEYYRPRIDRELIEKYHEGIICSSACLGGEMPQHIMDGNIDKAEETALWYKNIFGEDFYIELMLHETKIPEADQEQAGRQKNVNKHLLEIGAKHNIKCIVTNDVHFINEEDAVAHDHLICLNTGKNLDDDNRMRYSGQEFLKSYDQIAEMFGNHPELMENTNEIADKVEVYDLNHKPFMPNFPLPDDFVLDINKLKAVYKNSFINTLKSAKEDKRNDLALEAKEIMIKIEACHSIAELEQLVASEGPKWDKDFDAVDKLPIAGQYIYLEHITMEGAKERYGTPLDPEVTERLEYELKTIERMGFPGYFLIVWDFIRAAREMHVAVGPGRGSAAGSVVAYCLRITNIDPIRYGLLFERFLNPDRISMPDIDIDFDEDGREKVMRYVVDKYGSKRVAHIITFGRMGAKNSIRDVARVQRLPLSESDRLSKLVPERPNISLEDAFKESPELNSERNSDNELVRNTLKYAETLEGSLRQTGVHACGVIIGKDDLENYIPISTAKDTDLDQVVQYDGHYVEDIGLLKMDFLGLRTLSIIKDCLENIKISKGVEIDIDNISLDDEQTYKLYSNGDTSGIFQFESPGMKKYLRELKPSRFEDLIAMCALYRPGPMDYIPDFIKRKHGEAAITYDLDGMDEYLENTYGICVYQEQVMLLSQKLAGFTGGQADTLRKAMGKKIAKMLAELKEVFVRGAISNGHDKDKVEKVWEDWEKFASYAFNKSHATCYAYVSYQTAYLKAHYPSEFMAAVMSRNFSDISKISFFMDECNRMGRTVNGPDVNESLLPFSVDKDDNIRFGLSAIKGIGTSASESIIAERGTNGKFKDIYDFIERVDNKLVTKKTIENLILAGAFDSLIPFHRSVFFAPVDGETTFFDKWVKYGIDFKADKIEQATSLFSDFEDHNAMIQKPVPPANAKSWSQLLTLSREKELIGMYISSHPLDDYNFLIKKVTTCEPADLEFVDKYKDKNFCIVGIVSNVVEALTKKGAPFCKLTIEGYKGSFEFGFFGSDFDKFRNYYHQNTKLMVMGRVESRFNMDYRANVTEIMSLEEAKERFIRDITIQMPIEAVNDENISNLEEIFIENKGEVTPKMFIYDKDSNVSVTMLIKKYKIDVSQPLINNLNKYNIRYKI